MTTRPEVAYRVKRDRAISPRKTSPEMTVAFRVHYHHPADPSDYHRVSKLLYEVEAHDLAKNLTAAGFKLIDIEEWPGGIETVYGWDDGADKRPESLEPFAWYRRKSRELGELFRAETDVEKKLAIAAAFHTRVLAKLDPECSVREELKELFTSGETAR